MAIRFGCPACQQAIEIDDEWAGQSVGCPYCRQVVNAPTESTWRPTGVPMATPAASSTPAGGSPPPPPASAEWSASPGARRSPSAVWALIVSATSILLVMLGGFVWFGVVASQISEKLGTTEPTKPQVQEAMQEMMENGEMPSVSFSTACAVVGLLCGVGGIALGIRSLIRQEPRKVLAVLGCLLGFSVLFCNVVLAVVASGAIKGPPLPQAPSTQQAASVSDAVANEATALSTMKM